jgi:hypothetical protein
MIMTRDEAMDECRVRGGRGAGEGKWGQMEKDGMVLSGEAEGSISTSGGELRGGNRATRQLASKQARKQAQSRLVGGEAGARRKVV